MPRNILRLLVPESALVALAVVLAAAYIPAIDAALNPHTPFGGVFLLCMLAVCIASVVWLAVALPVAALALVRGSVRRNIANIAVVLAGVLLAVIYGGWLVVTFVLRP